MLKDTCLVAHMRLYQSPRINYLEIPCIAVVPERNHLIVGHTINQKCNRHVL
jgi:hypothetical protein